MRSRRSKIICIRCPNSCLLEVEVREDGTLDVRGNLCPIGKKYAEEEVRNPKRVVCSTVWLEGSCYPVLPVRTDKPIPKDKIFDLIELLSNVVVKPPIRRGDVILENVFGLGVNVIAEKTVEVAGDVEGSDEEGRA